MKIMFDLKFIFTEFIMPHLIIFYLIHLQGT